MPHADAASRKYKEGKIEPIAYTGCRIGVPLDDYREPQMKRN